MGVSPLVRPSCLVLGTVGLVQGLTVFVLSLLAILVHLCTITVEADETLTAFVPLVLGVYFQGAECRIYNTTILYADYPSNLVTPEWLFIWMAVYLVVSGLWIITSILIMTNYLYKKKTLHYFLALWIILTFGNCAMDLILAIYFGFDYVDFVSHIESNGVSLLPIVPFAMIILSLKGGVLWLINFAHSICAVLALHNYVKHKDDHKPLFLERAGFLDRSPINGFAPIEVPRPTTLNLNTKTRNVSTVSALRDYYMNNQETRSDLQSPISEVPLPLTIWKRQSAWEIPDPDYSPASTVTRLKNDTDSQSTELQHSLFNPIFPLRPSLKKKPPNYERKEDFRL